MTELSVVMVTKGEAHADWFINRTKNTLCPYIGAEFVLGLDGHNALRLDGIADKSVCVSSDGYLESVLDAVIEEATGKYVLRLDDDETESLEMAYWMYEKKYHASDVWAFPRANLWQGKAITTPPLWPDLQTRLTTREKAGGRTVIHQGSPYGTGRVAPVVILHHKFHVRTFDDRLKIAEKYESVKPGCGFGETFQPFNLPERSFKKMTVQDIGTGSVPNWQDMTGKGEEVTLDG